MKRCATLLLTLAMLLTLTACGSTQTASGGNQPPEESTGDSASSEKKDTQSSAADAYLWIAENDEMDYTIPDKSLAFIRSNPGFFPGSDQNTGAMSDFVDYDVDYPHVAKNPEKYADKLMSISGDIVDCKEAETDYGTVTYLHLSDYDGYSYCLYYLGTLEDAFEGYSAFCYALPFSTVTFENVGGAYTQAVVGAACYVSVDTEEYTTDW